MSFCNLPEELIEDIAAHLCFRDVLKLGAASQFLRGLVESSSLLRYHIELGASGHIEYASEHRDIPVERRLAALRRHHVRWARGVLRSVGPVEHHPRTVIKATLISSGVLVTSHPRNIEPPEGVNPRNLAHVSAPYPHPATGDANRPPLQTWVLHLQDGMTPLLAADPSQDLLLTRASSGPSASWAFLLSVLSLRTGSPHPLCAASDGILSIAPPEPWVAAEAHYTRVQVAGRALLVTFADRTRCAGVLVDWVAGQVRSRFVPAPVPYEPSWARVASTIALLAPDVLLHGTHDAVAGVPSIAVYKMPSLSTPDEAEPQPVLVKTYELPRLRGVSNARVYFSPFEAGKTCPFSDGDSNDVLFQPDPAASMLLIELVSRAGHIDETYTHELYTPIAPFLADARTFVAGLSATEPISWEAWGPSRTRWVAPPTVDTAVADAECRRGAARFTLANAFRGNREGARLVFPDHAVDFAPRALRRAGLASLSSESSMDAAIAAVLGGSLAGWDLVTATTIVESPIFVVGAVESRLPYLERALKVPAEADDFLLVGETVIGVNAGYQELEVYRLADVDAA